MRSVFILLVAQGNWNSNVAVMLYLRRLMCLGLDEI